MPNTVKTILLDFILYIQVLLRHLYLSVSSTIFYQKIYTNYHGYGFKYLLNITAISLIILFVPIIQIFHSSGIDEYLSHNTISNYTTKNIDFILEQIPEMNFNGKIISNSSNNNDEIKYIYDLENKPILVIDTGSKLSQQEKYKIPIIFNRETIKFNLNLINLENTKYTQINSMLGIDKSYELDYKTIFYINKGIINKKLIKEYLATLLNAVSKSLIYMAMPAMTLITLMHNIYENIVTFLFIFVIIFTLSKQRILSDFNTKTNKGKSELLTIARRLLRLIAFTNAPQQLLTPILFVFFPILLKYYLPVLKIWCHSLMIFALIKQQYNTT
ncbi:hypothetical protein [Rickettsia endosymbiont of Cardiosporidium cionae]|uniref:hypothetical protein n=1 Tax=Rickettsia endosymbiont of Cardiosporidium cionae TaxID=2777155 RepID=UPI0018937C54|nr:hypothetical protein [Rickettsia endosymbiont of Cardiosporidium cionae]KAF8818360.1 hypothetical protein IHI24_000822 [Rickettsia endosymbiont of Cardiosporidium cionae]